VQEWVRPNSNFYGYKQIVVIYININRDSSAKQLVMSWGFPIFNFWQDQSYFFSHLTQALGFNQNPFARIYSKAAGA
jgi:hypothetical protein